MADAAPDGPLQPADGEREAFERAVGALGRRERTVAELTVWLTERDYEPAVIGAVVGRLLALGELDDARFTYRYAEDKRELSGWGTERIRGALTERGVPRELVEAALAADSRINEIERAARLLAERRHDLSNEAGRARALLFLTRRGYDYEAAYDAIHRAEREARAA